MEINEDEENITKNSTSKNANIRNIEERVDRILLENKKKLDKLCKKELNLEKFSLRNKQGTTIYFFRKRIKDDEKNINSDDFINKNILETKKNRFKKPNEVKEKKEGFLSIRNKKTITQNPIIIDKEKENDKKYLNLKTNDNLIKSKEFDKVVSEIEKELDKIQINMENGIKKNILKDFIENSKFENTDKKEDIEKKSSKSNKENYLFIKNKTFKNEYEKSIGLILNTDDLKAEPQKILPIKSSDKKEKNFVDEGFDKFIRKRPFFKSKKTPMVKSSGLKQKSQDKEKINIKPIFPLEKISLGKNFDEEEAKLIDKKIIDSQKKEKSDEKPIKIESKIKVKKIDGEYLKNRNEVSDKKSRFFLKNKKKTDWISSTTDDLTELKKYETKKILPIKTTDKKDKIVIEKDVDSSKSRRHFFKTRKVSDVKPTVLLQKIPDKNMIIGKDEVGLIKNKKYFFKRKKVSDVRPKVLVQEISDIEKIKIKPTFNVEKIYLGDEFDEEEAKLIDKKIIDSQKKEKSDENPVIGEPEVKAKKIVEEHLKNRNEVTDNIELEQEHIFFDEEELPNYGWSPQIIEEGKKREVKTSITQTGLDKQKNIGEIELPKDVLSTSFVKLSDLGFSENEWEELDFYALHEPFAYVEILRQKETLEKCYFLVEMALTEEEENLLAFIKDTLISLSIETEEMDKKGEDEYLNEKLDQIIDEYNIKINEESKKKLFYFIGKSSLGLGKINPLMKDPNIEDISCDGSGVPVFLYHRKYGSLKSNVRFEDEEELSSFIFKLAQKCGKHISIAEPMLDATMPDGSRIQMTLSDEITAKGSTFTIRKFRSNPFSPTDLIEFNTMSSEMIAYMWIAVENGINTLFAGGTASGKTTTLNAILLFVPRESKIVSIEETREINLPHPNWIPGVARSGFGEIVADKAVGEIDTYDLMKAALRQRPEYIIVGEIRGKEAYVLFQAMATGHATYSTAHADSAQSLIHRLEGKPINIPRIMLQSLDLVCIHIITRVKNMRARRCKQIIEIIDIDPTTKEILTNEVFHWDPIEDKFIYSGKSYILERIRNEKDLTKEEMNQEIDNRKRIIEWMSAKNIRGFKDVANIVSKYGEIPEELLIQIGKDDNK